MDIVECVPNVSEGRNRAVIEGLAAAATAVPDVQLLDIHTDAVHHRSVLTLAGPPAAIGDAAFRLAATAATSIDLRSHRGVHPRIGALDVLPFVPLEDVPMERCIELAHEVGDRIARELQLPVYFYGRAALRPERRFLVDIRRGGYEALVDLIAGEAARAPDAGPAVMGPAGATAVGARAPLVAFNLQLKTSDLRAVRAIARRVRGSSGGLPGVQALAFETADPGLPQVSMNCFDLETTPVWTAVARVVREAEIMEIEPGFGELVGLIPLTEVERAAKAEAGGESSSQEDLLARAARALRLPRLESRQVIELALRAHSLPGVGA